MPDRRHSHVVRYAIALLLTAGALLVRLALDPFLGTEIPYASVFAAITAAAWFAGTGPALVTAALGYVAGGLLFNLPRGSVLGTGGVAGLALFWLSALAIVALGRAAHRATRRAQAGEQQARERAAALAEAERRLAERSDEVETILDLMPVGIFRATDASCTRIIGNRAAHELFGSSGVVNLSREAPEGEPSPPHLVFQHGREVPIPELPVQRAARGEVVKEQEYEIVFPDGARRHIFGSAAPLRDSEGRVRGAIAALLDITKRREVEIELEQAKHEAERQAHVLAGQARTLEALLEFVPEGIVMIGGPPDIRVLAVSRHGREMIGLPLSEILGAEAGPHAGRFGFLRADGRMPRPEEVPSWRALHRGEVVEHEEWLLRGADGRTARIALRSAPIRDGEGGVIGAIACWEDITRQKEAEEALRRSEALYRAIGESVAYGTWVCDADGRNIYASPSFLSLIGKTQQQCSVDGWSDALHPDDRERILAAWKACARSGEVWNCEQRFLGVDGAYHPILARGVPVRDEEGRIVQWAGILLDISDTKAAEDRLRRADRRKDEFLATLAHELRNPLAPIRNAVRLLQHRGPPDPEMAWAREVIDRQVSQMARLLDDLLDLSRIELDKLELQRERVTIGSVLEDALETSRPALEAGHHEVALELGAGDAVVLGDRVRLAQVFGNLLNNAAKYTDRGGHILLAAWRDGECVTVRVRDDGIGFEPGEAGGLFEMFSQTETARAHSGGGLGIGLALVRGLVEKHGGHVSAHSEGPGRGSEFAVTLPLAPALAPTDATPPDGGPAVPLRGRRVLVADDNEDAAESLAMLLRLRGHEVRTAHDGVKALAAAEAFRPEAAVIDVGMPGLSGLEVAERIRREPWGRGMLLVALTGWGQAEDRRRTDAAGFDHHLVKPAEPAELDHLLAASPAGG